MNKTKSLSFVMDELRKLSHDLPPDPIIMAQFYRRTATLFLSSTTSGTLEDCASHERISAIYDYLKSWLETFIEEQSQYEYDQWESGEYNYLLAESNIPEDDFIFEITIHPDDEPRCQPIQSEYTANKLASLGIDLLEYVYCKVHQGYGQVHYLGNDPFFYSINALEELEFQLCREAHSEDFFYWYDQLDKEHKDLLTNSFGYDPHFDDDCPIIYSEEPSTHPDFYIDYDALYEAIVDAEEELN